MRCAHFIQALTGVKRSTVLGKRRNSANVYIRGTVRGDNDDDDDDAVVLGTVVMIALASMVVMVAVAGVMIMMELAVVMMAVASGGDYVVGEGW